MTVNTPVPFDVCTLTIRVSIKMAFLRVCQSKQLYVKSIDVVVHDSKEPRLPKDSSENKE